MRADEASSFPNDVPLSAHPFQEPSSSEPPHSTPIETCDPVPALICTLGHKRLRTDRTVSSSSSKPCQQTTVDVIPVLRARASGPATIGPPGCLLYIPFSRPPTSSEAASRDELIVLSEHPSTPLHPYRVRAVTVVTSFRLAYERGVLNLPRRFHDHRLHRVSRAASVDPPTTAEAFSSQYAPTGLFDG